MGGWIMYLTSTNESAITAAAQKISQNCQLPNDSGTTSWQDPEKAFTMDLWFIRKPPAEGWGNTEIFTQEQMLDGVDLTDIVEMERNENWFPPPIPPFS